MRLQDILAFVDHWTISQSMLQPKIGSYFKSHNYRTDNVWYPDVEIIFPERLMSMDTIQVVLFGSFFEKIFETGNWPDKKFTFWCLSSRVQNILTEICGIPPEAIKCIPRYELFRKGTERPLDLERPLSLIYSGRLSSQKNIEFFLAFAEALSEKMKPEVQTYMLGKWDNKIPKHRGRYVIDSYQENVAKFQSKLKFKKRPVVNEKLDSHDWLNYLEGNSILVSFSTSIAEDYGVSVAQAQELGIPVMISDWGGHGDVSGSNVFHIPVQSIGESFTSDEKILLYAEKLAMAFLKDQNNFVKKANSADSVKKNTVFLSLRDLEQVRLKLMDEHGYEIGLFGQNLMSLYASSEKGKAFFNNVKEKMAGK